MGALSTRRVVAIAATIGLLALMSVPGFAQGHRPHLDRVLAARAGRGGTSRVIIRGAAGADVAARLQALGGRLGARLQSVDGYVADVPNNQLEALLADPSVAGVHFDRPVAAMLSGAQSVSSTVAAAIASGDQFDGTGVGVAIIDSGVTPWHDDLARVAGRPALGQRVMAFVDFVDGAARLHDDYGHGTHVAGIIAGNGWDANGKYTGVAPGADLLILRVLDGHGNGQVSDVIRALDFVVANHERYHIRVVNLSIGAAVLESYRR